jgi:periplasmic divalent cation tolerance protein
MMRSGKGFSMVLVTAPDLRTARRLGQAALGARLAACVNLIPKIESRYWWEGKIQTGSEVQMLFKTTSDRLLALEKLIAAKHPYDTPEFIVVSLRGGSGRYLDWLAASVNSEELPVNASERIGRQTRIQPASLRKPPSAQTRAARLARPKK